MICWTTDTRHLTTAGVFSDGDDFHNLNSKQLRRFAVNSGEEELHLWYTYLLHKPGALTEYSILAIKNNVVLVLLTEMYKQLRLKSVGFCGTFPTNPSKAETCEF